MSFRVIIAKEQCVGHARCANVAPHLYILDENGYIASKDFDVEAGEEVAAFRGAISCPERAIKMVDAEGQIVKKTPRVAD